MKQSELETRLDWEVPENHNRNCDIRKTTTNKHVYHI